jgi:hypothetical protein
MVFSKNHFVFIELWISSPTNQGKNIGAKNHLNQPNSTSQSFKTLFLENH